MQSGRRISGYYRDAGDSMTETGNRAASAVRDVGNTVVKFMENKEVSAGAANYAKLQSNLLTQWNETAKKADPNDPSVREKFVEEVVEPRLQQYREGFLTEGGQKFADSHVASLREQMFTRTAADMSSLAAVAVKTNYATTVNSLSNTVRTDPSSLSNALQTIDSTTAALADTNPNLTPAQAAQIKGDLALDAKKEVIKSAAIGAISINPEAGLKKFSSAEYSKYISGSELQQLTQQAKAVQRAERVDENYRRTIEKQQKQDLSDAREGDYLTKLHSGDPKLQREVSAKAIANDFDLTREARQRMIGIVERETKPEAAAKISNATTSDLIRRIRLPVGDPERIGSLDPVYEKLEKGELNKSDLKFVREEFQNMRTPEGAALGTRQEEFIASVKPLIDKSNPLMGKIDQSGGQQLYNFKIDLQRKIAEYKAAGKDPYSLMDPRSPDYMGNPAALTPYQKPLQQSLQDTAAALRNTNLTAPGNTITGVQVQNAPVATSVARPKPEKPPEIGFRKGGYEYIGGSPGAATSWKKVE